MAQVFHATGKRKNAIARVYVTQGDGKIQVNSKPLNEYFSELYQYPPQKPLKIIEVEGKYSVDVRVQGGGVNAQSEACMYGIAKALTLISVKNRAPLKKAMMLTRDARIVERKKFGHKKARKSFQFSKR